MASKKDRICTVEVLPMDIAFASWRRARTRTRKGLNTSYGGRLKTPRDRVRACFAAWASGSVVIRNETEEWWVPKSEGWLGFVESENQIPLAGQRESKSLSRLTLVLRYHNRRDAAQTRDAQGPVAATAVEIEENEMLAPIASPNK
eukprot:6202742-Pleurochrysis_carterae.AAC.3